MSLDYDAMQTALSAWVVAASGLDADDVLWAYSKYQGGSRPTSTPHITLRLGPSVIVGMDGLQITTDLTRPVGTEVQIATTALRRIVVRLQAFGGTPDGGDSAFAMLCKVRDRLRLPSVRDPLAAAGFSPYDPGAVMDVSFIDSTRFESRAQCDIGFYVDASESDYVGFIEHVQITEEIEALPLTGTVYLGAGSTTVIGVDTLFTSEVIAGRKIRRTADRPMTWTEVLLVADDNHMTLAAGYAGTTGSGAALVAVAAETFTVDA